MKLLVIKSCRECFRLNDNMYGTRCFHPSVCRPHAEGVVPKDIEFKSREDYRELPIPDWCPLENYQQDTKESE